MRITAPNSAWFNSKYKKFTLLLNYLLKALVICILCSMLLRFFFDDLSYYFVNNIIKNGEITYLKSNDKWLLPFDDFDKKIEHDWLLYSIEHYEAEEFEALLKARIISLYRHDVVDYLKYAAEQKKPALAAILFNHELNIIDSEYRYSRLSLDLDTFKLYSNELFFNWGKTTGQSYQQFLQASCQNPHCIELFYFLHNQGIANIAALDQLLAEGFESNNDLQVKLSKLF